ncbi:MAG: TIGR04024 family LLM class F420-dependent oxidoreductase [Haloarculaceae archaeon]
MTEAARDLFLPVSAQPSLDDFVVLCERAEDLGYDRAWLPETWGRDAVTILATVAAQTRRIGIGTSVTNVYSRSPALVGQTAATLQEASEGRLRLGLGPSGPILVENWHGVDYGNPLRRTRETVEIVRQVLSGEAVEYDGEYFDLSGFRLRHEPPETAPPVDIAGLGPTAVEMAGRFGDGWHAFLQTPAGLSDRMEDFRRGGDLGGRDPDDQRVMASLTCCALADRERARYLARDHVAFYVGAMGTFYRDALERQGYGEAAADVADLWGDGDREDAIDRISDDLLDDLTAAGHPGECRERLREFGAVEGVEAVAVAFPRAAERGEMLATVEALGPE